MTKTANSKAENLTHKTCKPCEGGVAPLQQAEAQKMLQEIPGWELSKTGDSIHRQFEFKNYYRVIAFVNAIAWIAHHENHHPDLEVGYNRCVVRYSTHAIDGLSENDFICAAKVNALLEPAE